MQDLLKSLGGMSPSDLVCNAKRLGTRLARGGWELAGHLLAIERTKAYLTAGYSSTVTFAEGVLALDAYKAVELLRVARLLEGYPRLSAAFADGHLAWSKLREVSRIVTPESENEWLQFALTHSAAEVQRRVVRSPRRQRSRTPQGSQEERPPATESQKAEQAEFDTPSQAAALEAAASPAPALEPTPPLLDCPPPVSTPEAPLLAEMSQTSEAATTAVTPKDAPATPPLVRITLIFTADEYAEFEKAMEQVQSRLGRRQRRERLVLELARGARSKAVQPRHMVLIHVDAKTDAGWYETERGAVPAERVVVESAVAEGRVAIVQDKRTCGFDDTASHKAADSDLEEPPAKTPRRPRGTRRKRLSVPMVEAVYARARGKCERCGRGGVLHIHHRRPWSENGDDSFANLCLLCSDCHVAHHERDYREKPGWRERRRFRTDARNATVSVATAAEGGP